MGEPTSISILYDDEALYLGFFMRESDPDSMMEALTSRDDYVTGDWIALLLDTWGEGTEAFSFEVSLANSRLDSRVSGGGWWDYSWDAVWSSATLRTDSGWSAEVEIPLSCLRFPDRSGEQPWTVNFQRVRGSRLQNGWLVLSDVRQMADLQSFLPLEGVSGIERSLGMEVRPYGAARGLRSGESGEWDRSLEAGLDVKLGVTSGLTADVTVNPDFGQVEADEAEMNLSHFELFLDEKRPFFLESESLFQMPFSIFYSRRVGSAAPNGEVIPILAGAKVSGTAGPGLRIGALSAVTGRVGEEGEPLTPAAAYTAARVSRRFDPYSYIGLSGVSREVWEQEGFEATWNRAGALDGAILVPGDHVVSGSLALSGNEGREEGLAASLELSRVRSRLGYYVGGSRVEEDFDVNATGYTTSTGYRSAWAGFHGTSRPSGGDISSIGYRTNLWLSRLDSGEMNGRSASVGGSIGFRGGTGFGANVSYSGETFDPYEGPEGRTYGDRLSFFAHFSTRFLRESSLWLGGGGGGYRSEGAYWSVDGSVSLRLMTRMEVGLEGESYVTRDAECYNWSEGEWDTRETEWWSGVLRLGYLFSPDLDLRLFSQYSRMSMDWSLSPESTSQELAANLLLSWRYMPGSMVYLLLESRCEGDGEGGLETPDAGIYGKVTWFLPV